MSVTPSSFTKVTQKIDRELGKTDPSKVIAGTALATAAGIYLGCKAYDYLSSVDWTERFKDIARQIPFVQEKLEGERVKLEQSIEKTHFARMARDEILDKLPETGLTKNQIMGRLKSVEGKSRNGKNSGALYLDDPELDKLISDVAWLARRTNPLHTDICPLVKQLENEVVSMCAGMFNGTEEVRGNITSGGTDSIRHAVFTTRERAKKELGIKSGWEMLLPETAHPAFDKAANEYGIKIRRVPVHSQGHEKAFEVDIDRMKDMINSKTILAVGSCPGYPHGIIDPIDKISTMLQDVDPKGRIGLHADYCLGGFIVPFMGINHVGFNDERITSISCDTHKYGYTEKGTSVVMYKNSQWHQHQIFVTTEWSGGIYATPTLPGSRSGRDIVSTWAVLAHMGRSGYQKLADEIVATAQRIATAIPELRPLKLLGNPIGMNLSFHSTDPDINIYDIKKEMSQRDWYIAGLQKPAGTHLCVTGAHSARDNFSKGFLKDLKECIEVVRRYPPEKRAKNSDASMYRSNEKIDEKMFVVDFARYFWEVHSRVLPQSITLPDSSNNRANSSSN